MNKRNLTAISIFFALLLVLSGCDSPPTQSDGAASAPMPQSSAATSELIIALPEPTQAPIVSPVPTHAPVPTPTPAPTPTPTPSSTPPIKQEYNNPLSVHFLDVGQADSIFIELPNKQTMLIDAGNQENGTDIVNYIKNKGYDTLDYIVATHPHADHIGGMSTVINSLGVKAFYMPKKAHTTQAFENMLSAIKNKGVGIHTAKSGVLLLDEGDLKFNIVSPVDDTYSDLNDYSVVCRLVYKNSSFLFMGDAESSAEGLIEDNIDVDVIKAGHHGSSTSSSAAFLSKVTPSYAVISCGKDNSYGHPHAETLQKFSTLGTKVYRTDESGTIIFETNGTDYKINTKPSENVAKSAQSVSPAVGSQKEYGDTPTTTVAYIGNANSKKFHKPTCGSLPAKQNQIVLNSKEEALNRGFDPCGKCKP